MQMNLTEVVAKNAKPTAKAYKLSDGATKISKDLQEIVSPFFCKKYF